MAVNKTVLENVELSDGEISVYIVKDKASLGVEVKSTSFSVWLTTDKLEQLANTIKKALEQ